MIKKFEDFVEDLLNERLSPILWHFCDFETILQILKTNSFKLSQSKVDRDELPGVTGYSKNRDYYMCFTRSKNSREGYSRIYSDSENLEGFVRLTVDGDRLNNIAHGKASDYFGTREDDNVLGKRALYKNIEKGKYKNIDSIYNHKYGAIQDNEKEDTLWFKKSEIPNVNKYIKRLDVYIPNQQSLVENRKTFLEQEEYCKELNIPIYFYNDLKNFDLQNNKNIQI